MRLILEAVLENISTRSDGSIKVSLATQEIDPSQAANLFTMRNRFMKVLLSDTNISPLEEKLVDEEQIQGGKKTKTSSQRLRAVMFRVHEASRINQEFDQWYKGEIENLITKYKDVLKEMEA